MKRIAVLAFAITLAVSCRSAHLGPDTGRAYRAAIHEQAADHGVEEVTTVTAADAKQILSVHRSGKSSGADSTRLPTASFGASSSGLASGADANSTGLWPGAQGGIKLEAK